MTSVSPHLHIHSVTVATIERNTLSIPTETTNEAGKTVKFKALVDSGAGGKFIDQNFTQQFTIKKLETPLKAYNVDGTENKKGTIRHYVDLSFTMGQKKCEERLLVTGLGKQKIILGFPWLNKHNPDINWKTGWMEWRNASPRVWKLK